MPTTNLASADAAWKQSINHQMTTQSTSQSTNHCQYVYLPLPSLGCKQAGGFHSKVTMVQQKLLLLPLIVLRPPSVCVCAGHGTSIGSAGCSYLLSDSCAFGQAA